MRRLPTTTSLTIADGHAGEASTCWRATLDVDGDTLVIEAGSWSDPRARLGVGCNETTGVCMYYAGCRVRRPGQLHVHGYRRAGDGRGSGLRHRGRARTSQPTCANVKPSEDEALAAGAPVRRRGQAFGGDRSRRRSARLHDHLVSPRTRRPRRSAARVTRSPTPSGSSGKPEPDQAARRARSGQANGRVYRIFYTVSDGHGAGPARASRRSASR